MRECVVKLHCQPYAPATLYMQLAGLHAVGAEDGRHLGIGDTKRSVVDAQAAGAVGTFLAVERQHAKRVVAGSARANENLLELPTRVKEACTNQAGIGDGQRVGCSRVAVGAPHNLGRETVGGRHANGSEVLCAVARLLT